MQSEDTRTPAPSSRERSRQAESIFAPTFFSHVFRGRVFQKRRGKKLRRTAVTGLHHLGGTPSAAGIEVLERSKPDALGVYFALVRVSRDGVAKEKQNIFFPADWSRLRVLEAVKEAYSKIRFPYNGRNFATTIKGGMPIHLCLDGRLVVSAWPLYSHDSPLNLTKSARRRRTRRARRLRAVTALRAAFASALVPPCDLAGAGQLPPVTL